MDTKAEQGRLPKTPLPQHWPVTPGWIACATALHAMATPAVILDRGVLSNNLLAGARLAGEAGVALHPHVKTHKSLQMATLQRGMGAAGVTAAKPSEAAVFLRAGLHSVTVAYPLLQPEAIRMLLAAASEGGGEVRFVVDSELGLDTLDAEARRAGHVLPVLMEVDVGLRRCGVPPHGAEAVTLATSLDRAPGLDFAGLLSHAGQAYGASGPCEVRAIAAMERVAMIELADRLRREGVEVRVLSVGSTPTVFLNDGFDGLTEVRPGNYVFMDLIQVALGVAQPEQVALQVLATVVSANPAFAILDAGSKVLSSDRAPHGADTVQGHGLALPLDDGAPRRVERLSEEHGFIVQDGAKPLRVGERVRVIPNHSCPVANLASQYVVVDASGTVEHWPIQARGMVT